MTIPDSEQIEEEDKVAYLRDACLRFLHPCYGYIQEKRCCTEGTALQFVRKLHDGMDFNTPEQKQQIFLMDIKRYLASHGQSDLAKAIRSREDILKLSNNFRYCFYWKNWFLNEDLSPENHDEYQLLSLGYRDGHVEHSDYPIPDLWLLDFVGNPLEADLQYKDFFNRLRKELLWEDTEEQGVRKAIEIRDKYFPKMKDIVIPWVLEAWAEYNTKLYNFCQKINTHCQLWDLMEKGEDYSEMIADPWIENEFEKVKKYIERRKLKGCPASVDAMIKNYFDVKKGEPKFDGGDYLLYVKEKIRMALKLGIIRKEDVEKCEAGSQFLKDIEHYNPDLFSYDSNPCWLRDL